MDNLPFLVSTVPNSPSYVRVSRIDYAPADTLNYLGAKLFNPLSMTLIQISPSTLNTLIMPLIGIGSQRLAFISEERG